MRGKVALLAVVGALAAAVLTPAAASAAPKSGSVPLPVGCTDAMGDAAGCTAAVVGFTGSGGQVSALVKFTNTATGQAVTTSQALGSPADLFAAQQASTCTILDLTIPPIDLFLLGIRIQTDTIHLLITAQRGTLLGNLLCGLFFGSQQNAGAVANVLNQFLRQGKVSTV